MRFHVVGLPHTSSTLDYLPCAYSQKQRNFCRMMMDRGHEVFHYGTEIDTPVTEHITIITKDEQREWFGENDWRAGEMFAIEWDSSKDYWKQSNLRAIGEILQRAKKEDFLCLIGGNCQLPIAAAHPGLTCVEFGVGYEGIFAKHRVFESYAHMHYVYGKAGIKDGLAYDAVIPNYYDPDLFPLGEGGDYLLYMGRLIERKGIQIVNEIAARTDLQVIAVGQGDPSQLHERIDYRGVITDPDERAKLMGGARTLLCPTQYIEPFGGVHAEAMMCGTPVITSDWGVFTETVTPMVGFRCRTLKDYLDAVESEPGFGRIGIRAYAQRFFSLDTVGRQYESYFDRLLTLWGDGWYTTKGT